MSTLRPFISCLSPISITDTNGIMRQVPCNSCPACLSRKSSIYESQLINEMRSNLYNYMLTLTYDDESVPRFTPCFINSSEVTAYALRPVGRVSALYSENPLCRNRKDDNYKLPLPIYGNNYESFVSSLDTYFERRKKYADRYPKRNHDLKYVHLLCVADLQNYIKRLRKLISNEYDEKIRIFAVGEYGTESLRPHFHIVLSHNSPALHTRLTSSLVVTMSRKQADGTVRECKCPKYLCDNVHPLWPFGATVCEPCDVSASPYIAGYLNGTCVLPRLLVKLSRPKTYHSIKYGAQVFQKVLDSSVQTGDFDSLYHVNFANDKGIVHSIPVPRCYTNTVFPRLPFNFRYTFAEQLRLYTVYNDFTKRGFSTCIDIVKYFISLLSSKLKYANAPVRDRRYLQLVLLSTKLDKFHFDYFDKSMSLDLYSSPLYAFVRTSKRFCNLCSKYNKTASEYLTLINSYQHFDTQRNLKNLFSLCESDDSFAKDYYSLLPYLPINHSSRVKYFDSVFYPLYYHDNLTIDYNFLRYCMSSYDSWCSAQYLNFGKRIKHSKTAALYNDI